MCRLGERTAGKVGWSSRPEAAVVGVPGGELRGGTRGEGEGRETGRETGRDVFLLQVGCSVGLYAGAWRGTAVCDILTYADLVVNIHAADVLVLVLFVAAVFVVVQELEGAAPREPQVVCRISSCRWRQWSQRRQGVAPEVPGVTRRRGGACVVSHGRVVFIAGQLSRARSRLGRAAPWIIRRQSCEWRERLAARVRDVAA